MSSRARAFLPLALGAAALALWVGIGLRGQDRLVPVASGRTAPDLTVSDLEGRPVALSEFRGRVMLLNVWATWCPPCVWEMPAMERLYRELGDEGLEVVAVSVDVASPAAIGSGRGSGDAVHSFVQERGLTFTVLLDPDRRIERLYQVRGLPTSYLVDRDGVIRRTVLGPAEWDQPPYSEWVRELLEE